MEEGLWVSRAELILHALEQGILQGDWQPGDRLDERQIAEMFDVSRTPVREAIQRLAASGLVQVRGRSGAIVVQLSPIELLDGFTVVAELEALAAAQAARRRLPAHLEDMRAAHDACAEAARSGDIDRFYDANLLFHRTISQASQNRVLQEQLLAVTIKTAPYRRYVTHHPARMESSMPEHAAILDAVERSDAAAAAMAMRGHVNLLREDAMDFIHYLKAIGRSDLTS